MNENNNLKPKNNKSNKSNKVNELNNENNKISIKLKELCEDELNRYTSYFEHPGNENDKKLFIKFIFYDIFKIDNPVSETIKEITENPSSLIELYFEKVTSRNNFNNIIDTIKAKFIDKKKLIKEKIKECNEHLKLLRSIYLNLELKDIFEDKNGTSKQKLIFANKKVLIYPEINKLNYELSEIFARYIFTAIHDTYKNNPDESKIDNFYSETKITSFVNRGVTPPTYPIYPFTIIENNFKYWFILLFIISKFLAVNSDYSILFNQKEFEKLIEKLVKMKTFKKKEGDGKKKKKKKQKGGANPSKKALLSQPSSKGHKKGDKKDDKKGNKKNENKDNKEKKIYEELFNKCYVNITNSSGVKESQNLKKIYNGDDSRDIRYKLLIQNYFNSIEPFLGARGAANNTNSIDVLQTYTSKPKPNIFAPSDEKATIKVNLEDIGKKRQDIKKSDVTSYLDKVIASFDIFQSLRLLLEKNNQSEIEQFIDKIKMKLVLFLYILYKIKKNIYETFIKSLNETFFEQNNNENNSTNNISNKKNNRNNNKNYVSRSRTRTTNNISSPNDTNYNSLPSNIRSNVVTIDKEIKLLKQKINSLDQDNIYYEKKILALQNKINELYSQKYELVVNIVK
jgi:hypothetical protein